MNQNQSSNLSQYFMHIRQLLASAYDWNEARALALILFEHYINVDAKKLITGQNNEINDARRSEIYSAVQRLLVHEPVQHITGNSLFSGSRFFVNRNVLIPRPETEELVDWVKADYSETQPCRIADIGTGSGCIAISLSLVFRQAKVDGFDVSPEAIAIADKNNQLLGANASFYICDIFNPENWPSEHYDIIVSNPPYIPESEKPDLPLNVNLFEPPLALFVPDSDPLVFYRAITRFASHRMPYNGRIYLEVHRTFAEDVADLFRQSGFGNVIVKTDLNNRKRMVKAER